MPASNVTLRRFSYRWQPCTVLSSSRTGSRSRPVRQGIFCRRSTANGICTCSRTAGSGFRGGRLVPFAKVSDPHSGFSGCTRHDHVTVTGRAPALLAGSHPLPAKSGHDGACGAGLIFPIAASSQDFSPRPQRRGVFLAHAYPTAPERRSRFASRCIGMCSHAELDRKMRD